MTLNSVLLPAPFGPISPQVCPASTSKETSLSAAMPPKLMQTFLMDRRDTSYSFHPLSVGDHSVGGALRGGPLRGGTTPWGTTSVEETTPWGTTSVEETTPWGTTSVEETTPWGATSVEETTPWGTTPWRDHSGGTTLWGTTLWG